MNTAITGANGFVGNCLCQHYHKSGHQVFAVTQQIQDIAAAENWGLENYSNIGNLSERLTSVDVIIHLAGNDYTRKAKASDYYKINLDQTSMLARASIQAKVKQSIF